MAKEKRVKMYNKGTRNWTFKDNEKEITCAPGKSVELNEGQAKKFVKNYPHDFLAGEPVQRTNDSKKLKNEIKKLTEDLEKLAIENGILKDQIVQMQEANKPVKNTEPPKE